MSYHNYEYNKLYDMLYDMLKKKGIIRTKAKRTVLSDLCYAIVDGFESPSGGMHRLYMDYGNKSQYNWYGHARDIMFAIPEIACFLRVAIGYYSLRIIKCPCMLHEFCEKKKAKKEEERKRKEEEKKKKMEIVKMKNKLNSLKVKLTEVVG